MFINSPHTLNGKAFSVAWSTGTTQRLDTIEKDISVALNDIKELCNNNATPLIYRIDLLEDYSKKVNALKADYLRAKKLSTSFTDSLILYLWDHA